MSIKFKPIQPKSISDEIVSQIKTAIMDGSLKPGEKLPSERDISATLGVSRQCVREAINYLKAVGLLDVKKRSGIYAECIASELIKGPLQVIINDIEKVYELMDIRKVLDSYSTYYAAKNATEEDVGRIGRVLSKLEQTIHDFTKYDYDSEFEFHLLIAQASHNTMLLHIIDSIYDTIMEAIRKTIDITFSVSKDNRRRMFQYHKAIFDAIRSGDSKKAARNLVEHFEFAETEMKKGLPNHGQEEISYEIIKNRPSDFNEFFKNLLR